MTITADATVTSKGQVTIPKEIRDRVGIEAGDSVEFVLNEAGHVEVHPKDSPMEQLEAIREDIASRHGDIDVDAMRERSKDAWSSSFGGDE